MIDIPTKEEAIEALAEDIKNLVLFLIKPFKELYFIIMKKN